MLFHHDKFNFISVFRLWAEVFHVSASGAGTVKWQQVSEDLVPVNITCIQDSPECIFHITAYNSQVDKILDVRLVQPGLWPLHKFSPLTEHLLYFTVFFINSKYFCTFYYVQALESDRRPNVLSTGKIRWPMTHGDWILHHRLMQNNLGNVV